MSKNNGKAWEEKYEDLRVAAGELDPYYDIDKVKAWSVYVWTKPCNEDEHGKNVFDIEKDEIVFYDKNHIIPEEVMPIIENIQNKLKELDRVEVCND